MSETKKPKLIVFDLDYTLWPFWVDTHVTPPFHEKDGKIYDRQNRVIKPFPEVPGVLQDLHQQGYELAIASRTSEIQGANQLVKLFKWDKYFKYKEIYPGCKVKHFSKFCKDSGYKHEEMLFFDDEHRNIRDLTEKGVTCILVSGDGVTKNLVKTGLEKFAGV
ncbi:hypothetical protein ONE63_002053 [Megalurothrips usitatus]|uniref:Magnesium-dependent phosphatase 1-like n=1 Tax=Megalurothrips usitatus TaxID=439358 RepID=A0AAV7XH44_9NEOP|nr:hypothetical protein ONE63_002053 [Megalurothrips usitatus]